MKPAGGFPVPRELIADLEPMWKARNQIWRRMAEGMQRELRGYCSRRSHLSGEFCVFELDHSGVHVEPNGRLIEKRPRPQPKVCECCGQEEPTWV